MNYEFQQWVDLKWMPVGRPNQDFGILYRELHANRQHPHNGMRVIDKESGTVIMNCWSTGFIEPFNHGHYSHLTHWAADFR